MTAKVDIIIVGSGASGAAAAWRLSQDSNLSIVCIEQGRESNPAQYPTTKADWERDKQRSASFDPNVRANKADYPIDNSNSAISLANFNGFGGSTILYSGHFPRFHPSDFATYKLDKVAEDWPFDYQTLTPYFNQNEEMMGVAGLVGDTAYPEYENLLPPVAMGRGAKKLAQAFNRLGWHWWPSYSAINTKNHQNRPPCINLGPCNTGCSQGAKGSVDITYWPQAKLQGVQVMTECRVFDIPVDKEQKATGVKYYDKHGSEQFLAASLVILACSGIGTPRLLLNSKSELFPNGLLNNYDLVGRNLMLHPLAYVEGVFDEPLDTSIGPQGCSIYSQQFYETQEDRGFKRGYTLHVLRGSSAVDSACSGYITRRIPLGKNHHQAFSQYFNHNMGIAVISEDLPDPENRIELDYSKTDRFGMPGIKVHYSLHENTKKMLEHGIEQTKKLFAEAGAKISAAHYPVKHAGWHLMGTTKMGADKTNSVVNEHGQAHEVSNLFIVDSSVFITSGAVNPVATAQALTLKFCDHISKNIKSWVV
ncbi:choline dehydrogenase [Pseudoalteromonas sp. BMB]|uniref:GMC family oxidoreductase n=1 Tax=Pseudoalteromonas sp. BMB TaxID=1874619 RepID=UPI00083E245E|nr:GMC family oxidoreductase [Pseudoalteromonas sp. BMB]ODB43103.1 choline dehydrogenase [Pseudoalteromonas sp. BMB]